MNARTFFALGFVAVCLSATPMFAQTNKKQTEIIIDGSKYIIKGRPIHNKNEIKGKVLEIDSLSYDEAKAAKEKYETDGWTYEGMWKCEDGSWTIRFTQK